MNEKQKRRRTGYLYGAGTPNDHPPAIETFPDDPADPGEVYAAAMEVVEVGTMSTDGRNAIVPDELIDSLRKALETNQ